MTQQYKILFLNPRSAYVFQDMARDVAACWSPSAVWTEVSDVIQFHGDNNLEVKDIPRCACYNRSNYFFRIATIFNYFFYVLWKVLFNSSRSLLFIVTMPPFLGLIGYIFKRIRKQKYVVLVYDILPAALIRAGLMKDGIIARIWRRYNRMVLNSADAVITIGEHMADNLMKEFDVHKTPLGRVVVIHNWADVESIKPLPENENQFIRQYNLQDKFIVMYSGNIGATHDMETLVAAAVELKGNRQIQFVIVGEGARKQYVVDSKEKYGLDNMLILSYLPQEQLVYSLPAADIAIATIAGGVEGYLVPCKFYAYLAAGNAVVAVCNSNCEMADIINTNQCGRVVALGDSAALAESILYYYKNKDCLDKAKAKSRIAAVTKYSRKNTSSYIEIIDKVLENECNADLP